MPVSQRAIAAHWGISQPSVAAHVKRGCPTNSLRAADVWREQNRRRKATAGKAAEPSKGKGRPKKPAQLHETGDTLLDALNATIVIQKEAFRMVTEAMAGKDIGNISPLLSVHTKSVESRLNAETAYRVELERRGVLVNKQEITERCRHGLDTVLRRVNKLPSESGPQCNRENPMMAVTILQRAVDEIKSAVQSALGDL